MKKGKGRKSIKARDFGKNIRSSIETGNPYIYKDMQMQSQTSKIGTIRSSNLCKKYWNILLR